MAATHTVVISRTYLGCRGAARVLTTASPDASWSRLLALLGELTVTPFHRADGTDGVEVGGVDLQTARRVHDLSCRHGALPVIQ